MVAEGRWHEIVAVGYNQLDVITVRLAAHQKSPVAPRSRKEINATAARPSPKA